MGASGAEFDQYPAVTEGAWTGAKNTLTPEDSWRYTPRKLGSELNMRSPPLTLAAAALCIFVGVAAGQVDVDPFTPLRVAQGASPWG